MFINNFSIPTVPTLPADKAYVFNTVCPEREPSPQALDSFKTTLRDRIKPEYESNLKRTPTQKKRIAIAVFAVLATIAAIALLTVAIIHSNIPLAFAATPFIVLAGAGFTYVASVNDLDNRQTRTQVMQEIAAKSFDQIATSYDPETIEGYGLLDRIVAHREPSKRDAIYLQFAQLDQQRRRIQAETVNERDKVKTAHTQAIGPIEAWRSDKLRLIEQGQTIRHIDTYYYEQYNGKPSTFMRTIDAVGSFMDTLNKRDIERIYAVRTADWNTWRTRQLTDIKAAHEAATNALNGHFASLTAS
jgi:hypothetical protein